MIDRLSGRMVERDAEGIVLDVGGVGFRIEMPSLSLRNLQSDQAPVTVYTHLSLRDDGLQLFGFSSEEERTVFLLLQTVSKVGPKLALALLSRYTPREILRALAAGDARLLASVPGLGRRTAERLVLELREKVLERWGGLEKEGPHSMSEAASSWTLESENIAFARSALLELGYTAAEAEQALRGISPDEPVESILRKALLRRS